MGTPFIGDIRMFGGNFSPQGYALCEGQLQAISQNQALFALIGTTYGGDGVQTFALPDLRGRAPVHMGTGRSGTTYVQGQLAGTETVPVSVTQMPAHSHPFTANPNAASTPNPLGNIPAAPTTLQLYDTTTPVVPAIPMSAAAIGVSGGSQPHENMQPFVAITFIIALFGAFPSRN